jgi:outer membrane protein
MLGSWVVAEAAEPLSLADAVRRAVANHPRVESARANVKAAAEGIPEAKAGYLPRIEFQENWVRSNNPVFVFGSLLTQRQFGAQNFAIESLNRPDALNQFQSLLMAEQVLWDAGRTRKSVEMAEIRRKTASVGVKQMELALASRTSRAYLDVQLTRAAIGLAEEAVRSAEADLKQAQAIHEVGRATGADALSVKVHLSAMQEQLLMRRAEAKIAARMLNELIGAEDAGEFELTTAMSGGQATQPETLERPEVERGKLDIDAARKQSEIAKLAWKPQVGLRLGFEADRQRFVTRAGANWMAGVSLKWALYQGGADRARSRMAVESERAALLGLQATERQVKVEVMEAATLLDATRARVQTAQSAIASAEESLRITQDRYEAGLENVTALLRSEIALTEARLRLLAAEHGVKVARLNQAAALGTLGPDSEVLR